MKSKFLHIESISSKELASEWDCLATERHQQINNGLDVTFKHVMIPLIESLIEKNSESTLIDIGSGTGELTKHIAKNFKNILCIEPSNTSIEIAKSILSENKNISFINSDFENHKLKKTKTKTIFLAAMMLSATTKIDAFAKKLNQETKKGDEFIATIPHPCFWPRYWGYESEPWFSYEKEIIIKAPFKISLSDTEFKTTHIHRPIEKYISTFSKNGFLLVESIEPIPSKEIQSLYPKKWDYPRFLAFKWIRN